MFTSVIELVLGWFIEAILMWVGGIILFPVVLLVSLPVILLLALFRRDRYNLAVSDMLTSVCVFWREWGLGFTR